VIENLWKTKEERVKIRRLTRLLFCVGVASMSAGAQVRLESRQVIERRIPVAVPPFAANPDSQQVGREFPEIIADDLRFTGLFDVLEPADYPSVFHGFPKEASNINFEAWKKTRAEHLVFGYVMIEGDQIVAECRLFDLFTVQQVEGQRLRVERTSPRRIPHKFADAIVYKLTGTPGIASSVITFSAKTYGAKEIYVADYDGANAKRLTDHGSISIQPEFAPDGRRIVYLSYKDRYPFLYLLDIVTGESSPFSKHVGMNAAPAWTPDGQAVALVLSKDGDPEIYIKDVGGPRSRRLTENSFIDMSPTFDPRGEQIAFVSDRRGIEQIFSMNRDGGGVRRLSFQGGRSYDPAWSPDGKYIAYVVERAGDGLEIYVMDADGTNPRRLTNSYGSNESPTWSPDTRHIMFASTRSGRSELWAVTLETGEERRVPNLDMPCQSPSWGPRRP